MTILELYMLMQPLICFLGSICMIVLIACGTLFVITWLVKKLWKAVLTLSTVSFFLFLAILVLGAM